jgi:hypothetical protein
VQPVIISGELGAFPLGDARTKISAQTLCLATRGLPRPHHRHEIDQFTDPLGPNLTYRKVLTVELCGLLEGTGNELAEGTCAQGLTNLTWAHSLHENFELGIITQVQPIVQPPRPER